MPSSVATAAGRSRAAGLVRSITVAHVVNARARVTSTKAAHRWLNRSPRASTITSTAIQSQVAQRRTTTPVSSSRSRAT